MKREGRQHGMVRSYGILPFPRPKSRFVQQLDSPPIAGVFTRVPTKPTNHSKFTGRCGRPRCLECRMHPACKSKDKAKGTHKFKSNDMVVWSVMDEKPGFNFSATKMLDSLSDYDDRWDLISDGRIEEEDDTKYALDQELEEED